MTNDNTKQCICVPDLLITTAESFTFNLDEAELVLRLDATSLSRTRQDGCHACDS